MPGFLIRSVNLFFSVLAYQKSSAAIGFFRLFTIAFLWIGVSVPLVFVGAYYGIPSHIPLFLPDGCLSGYQRDIIEVPCKVRFAFDTLLP